MAWMALRPLFGDPRKSHGGSRWTLPRSASMQTVELCRSAAWLVAQAEQLLWAAKRCWQRAPRACGKRTHFTWSGCNTAAPHLATKISPSRYLTCCAKSYSHSHTMRSGTWSPFAAGNRPQCPKALAGRRQAGRRLGPVSRDAAPQTRALQLQFRTRHQLALAQLSCLTLQSAGGRAAAFCQAHSLDAMLRA